MDGEPEEPDGDPEPEERRDDSELDDYRAAADAQILDGRDLWLRRLQHLCEVSRCFGQSRTFTCWIAIRGLPSSSLVPPLPSFVSSR